MFDAEGLIGRRLLGVVTSWHHYGDHPPSLLHMWLDLDGLGTILFRPVADGLLLSVDQPHAPYAMDEFGHTTVERDLPEFPMARCVGSRVRSVRRVHYRDGGRGLDFEVGVALGFPADSVRVLNLADELLLARDEHLGAVEQNLYESERATAPRTRHQDPPP